MSTRPPRPGTCPRCGTAVTGSFKFCPACAYRLESAPLPPPETQPANGRWLRTLVFLTFGLLVVAIVATGILLFRPPPEPPAPPPARTPPRGLEGPLRVDEHLLAEMVPLERRPAALTEVLLPDGGHVDLEVRLDGYMRILRYEATRGMYAEYVRDCQAHPERIPEILRVLWDPPPLPEPPEDPDDEAAVEAYRDTLRRAQRLRADAEGYVAAWWERLAEHDRRTRGRTLTPPSDLRVPVSPAWQRRLIVPPSWVRVSEHEDYDDWALPEVSGRIPENYPVTDVSWYDAEAFASWATARLELPADRGFRLPTWTEWMRAGHGGELSYVYPWGEETLIYACNNRNFWRSTGEGGGPLPVDYRYSDASFGQTREHLWAMSGNAREWTRNDKWVDVGGDLEAGNPPDHKGVVPLLDTLDPTPLRTAEDDGEVRHELDTPFAPTMGGSYDDQIGDCNIGLDGRDYRYKWRRFEDVGFRLYLPGYGDYNPLLSR